MSGDTTRTRFLGAIAAQLPVGRVVEVHLFGAIRQGGAESGVAVIAVDSGERTALDGVPVDPPVDELSAIAHRSTSDVEHDSPYAGEEQAEFAIAAVVERVRPRRYTVYTARYRHTLKGPERGKWEATVTEEADAPLLTVDAVVRGVSRRSGEADETVRLSGDEFRAALPAVDPTGPRRPPQPPAHRG